MCPVGLPVPQDVVRQRRELVVTQERRDVGVPQVPVDLGGPGAVVTCGDESGQGVTEVPGAYSASVGTRLGRGRPRSWACVSALSLSRAFFCVLLSMVIRLVGVRLPAGADTSATQRPSRAGTPSPRRWLGVDDRYGARRRSAALSWHSQVGCCPDPCLAVPAVVLPCSMPNVQALDVGRLGESARLQLEALDEL